MRIIIQRVSRASVKVDGKTVGIIERGLLAFVGFRDSDTEAECDWLASKLCQLRIFPDGEEKMNLSVEAVGGSVLVVSQFTLYGDANKGNRPNFLLAARPEKAQKLYQEFLAMLRSRLGTERVSTGVFQAAMEVELTNDGPVTILLEREVHRGGSPTLEFSSMETLE